MSDTPSIIPEWVRPKTAIQYVEIGMTTLYALIKIQAIKTRLVKSPGAIRGNRLIYLPSLIAWVEAQEGEGAK